MRLESAGHVEGNGGALVARLADVWAERDRARMAELDAIVKGGGRCRFCRHRLAESSLSAHPGVCGVKACIKRAKEEAAAQPLPVVHEEPARPAEEAEMPRGKRKDGPCPGCGTLNTRCPGSCPTKSGGEAPAAPKPRRAPKEAERILAERTVEELVTLRSDIDDELRRREDEAEKLLERPRSARRVAA